MAINQEEKATHPFPRDREAGAASWILAGPSFQDCEVKT